ncbi:MAG: hypothetical protein QW794_02605 [Thermosphaera sp.]
MKVYEITMRNYEPLLMASVKHGRLIKHELKYLPGSAIRGALLTLLKLLGSKRVQEEIERPSIIFHPAYPLAEDNSQTRPAHPLIYECKICHQVFSLSLKDVIQRIDDFKVPIGCGNGHLYAIKSLGGSLIYQQNDKLKCFSPRYISIDSIGINRLLRTTEIGLLYSYVALAPGHTFRGLIVDPNDKLEWLFEEVGLKLNDLELKVGRRASAGLGGIKAKISELRDYQWKLADKVKDIKDYEGDIFLLAKSPIFNLDIMEVDGQFKILSLSKELVRRLRNLKVKYILKTKIVTVSGFSLASGTPKVRLYGLDIGSLIVVEDNLRVEDLVDIELMGVGPFSIAGFNIVEVMKPA